MSLQFSDTAGVAGAEASSRPARSFIRKGALRRLFREVLSALVGEHRLGSHPPLVLILKHVTSLCLNISGYKMGLLLYLAHRVTVSLHSAWLW